MKCLNKSLHSEAPRCVWFLLCGRNYSPVAVSKVLQCAASNAHCNLAVCTEP